MIPAFLHPASDSMASVLRQAGQRPRLHALHLLWSVWLFMTPLFTPVGPGYWWSLAFGYPLFLLLFWLTHVRSQDEAGLYFSALAILAVVSMPWNASAWTYGVFACVYVPYAGSLRASVLKMAMVQSVLVLEAWWLGWPWLVSLLLVGVCTSSGFGNLVGRINARKNIEQRLSLEEIRRLAASAERERIGRDLHDLLGHTLSLISLKLELSRKLFDRDHEAARREMAEAEEVARHALAEVRSAVTGIRSTDLAAEFASARLLLESSGVRLQLAQAPPPLPVLVERALSLIVREAVTNIARHAHASHAQIDLQREHGMAVLRISDDGRGGIDDDGNGLAGMRERVRTLGGTLAIDSSRGHGTTLTIRVPLPAPSIDNSGVAAADGWSASQPAIIACDSGRGA